MKYKLLPSAFIFFFILLSCHNDDEHQSAIKPSSDFIEMEAEGGESKISFPTEDWTIGRVINNDKEVDIFGNVYATNGDLIHENKVLALEGEGRLMANWKNKGFTVTKDAPTGLTIDLKENSSGEEFTFTILINSLLGEDQKEIRVSQKPSQGYDFKKIEFYLKPEDGDSLFMENGTRREFDIQTTQTISFSPFGGIDIHNSSHFESDQEDAFVWFEKDSLTLEVPTSIANGELSFKGETRRYTDEWNIQSHDIKTSAKITLPEGQSALYTEIEFRKRIISYLLTLTNKRTGEDKTITGKWIEIAPTGEYSVEWEK